VKQFRIRNDRGQERSDNRRKHKANRHATKRLLQTFNGLIEHEFDFQRREKVSAKASLEAMKMEENKRKTRLQPVSVMSNDDGYDWSFIDDAMADSHGDPYSIPDNWDDQPVSEFEEPSYFANIIDDAPWYKPRNAYEYLMLDMPELPIDKGNRGEPIAENFIGWLDRQVGRLYHEVYAEAKKLASKNWWVVRKLLLELCTTNGRSLESDNFDGKVRSQRFCVDVEGILHNEDRQIKKRYARPSISDKQVWDWLNGRQVVACGAHLFWYVCTSWSDFHAPYRQHRELNAAEMEFFIQLDNDIQADLLQRFQSVEQARQMKFST